LRAKGGGEEYEKEEVYLSCYFRSWKVTIPSSITILFTVGMWGGDKAEATEAATAAAERGGVGAVAGAAPLVLRVAPAAPVRPRLAGLLRSRRGCFWEDTLSVTGMNALGSGAWKADWALQAQALVRWSSLWHIVH
jgi:hypothetical protein